ncbi:MAG: hypothetical protein BRC30_01165 [Nanohaloarchaea archaeon SW_7_46_7]|nr:MAG: hypothetical protein BRC30_01165 [Nanohaloarchaea archaeon SW_7_46_7]
MGTKPGRGLPVKQFQPRKNTSLMIGRESSGLTNEELNLCDAVVHIEVPGYSSLNQSHATAIMLHELTQGKSKALGKEQKKALKDFIGDGKIMELIMRGSPTDKEFDRLIGEIKNLEN